MPNRIIKESVCSSDSIDHLSIEAERLFYRIIVNCDDYGVLDARLPIIKSKCFPLKSFAITDNQLESWLLELETQNMIFFYENSGHQYLKMSSWERHQQIRAKRPKYPLPGDENSNLMSFETICNQMISNVTVIQSNPIRNPIQSESNPNPVPAQKPPHKTPDKPATEPPPKKKDFYELSLYEQVRIRFVTYCPSLPKPKSVGEWTPARRKAIRDKKISADEFTEVFKRIEQSDFLTGKATDWHGCSIDWILKPANWQKIVEGNYDNRESVQHGHETSYDIDEYEKHSIFDDEVPHD